MCLLRSQASTPRSWHRVGEKSVGTIIITIVIEMFVKMHARMVGQLEEIANAEAVKP